MNPKDTVCLDVPLFIRLLEYAREDANTDMDLHNVAENAIELSKTGEVLGMQEYEMIVSGGQLSEGFDLRKYLSENRLLEDNGLQVSTNGNYEVDEEIYVSLGGEEYTGTIDEEGNTLFIHYYEDDEYHNENDAPEIFKRMEELGGDIYSDDDEAYITINIDKLK